MLHCCAVSHDCVSDSVLFAEIENLLLQLFHGAVIDWTYFSSIDYCQYVDSNLKLFVNLVPKR